MTEETNYMIDGTDFKPPFEVGEYMDIRLRVYLDKEATDKGEHFTKPSRLAMGVAYQMNESYRQFQNKPYWRSGKIWFVPIEKI